MLIPAPVAITRLTLLAALIAAEHSSAQPAATDRFGDPLPPGVLVRVGSGRMRHVGLIDAMALSPDGKLLAIGGAGRLRVWEVSTGKLLRQFEILSDLFLELGFSRDSAILTSVDGNRKLSCRRFDMRTGKELSHFVLKYEDAALSADGKLLAIVRDDKIARLLDTGTGNEIRQFPVRGVGRPVFSTDGKLLAVGAQSKAVQVYEMSNGQFLQEIRRNGESICELFFSPDGRSLAIGNEQMDASFVIWELTTKKEQIALKVKGQYALRAAFSPDGRLLAATGPGATDFIIWDLKTGKELRRFDAAALVRFAQFTPDGKTVIGGCLDGTIHFWELATGRHLPNSADPPASVYDLRFNANGSQLIGSSGGRGRSWDPVSFRAWDSATGREVRQFPPGLHLSPDGLTLIGLGKPGMTQLIDTATGKERRSFPIRGSVETILWSPDNRKLFTGGITRKEIRVWDIESGREGPSLVGQAPFEMAASADGRWLAVTEDSFHHNESEEVHLWNLALGHKVGRFFLNREWAHVPAFSPDSRLLAAAGGFKTGTIQVWELATGKELASFDGHTERVICMAFAPDGHALATGSIDHTVRIWELASGRERTVFRGHQGVIYSLAFSPDGRRLAASSPDAPVFIWPVADAAEPRRALTVAEVERAWADLKGDSAQRAFRAIGLLAADSERSLPFLTAHLKPIAPPDAERLRAVVRSLESSRFAERERATTELEQLADSSRTMLKQSLAETSSAEARRRLQSILDGLDNLAPQIVQQVRAVEVLERIGSPARPLLLQLAGGAPDARLTRDAKSALERVKRP